MRPTTKYLASLWVTTVTLVGQPYVLERATSVYAVVPDALALSFGADGALYVGRDASGSGGGTGEAVKIHRVAPGGGLVTEYGEAAISDPDALIVDLAGAVSGTPGSVLVGGVHPGGNTGKIVKIAPDETVTTLFGPSAALWNPSGFAFDASGRLLHTDISRGQVLATVAGGTPTALFELANVHHLAVDALDRIVVSTSSSTALRLYSGSGVLSNGNFGTVKASSPLARGPGGDWGTDLYAVAPNGDLVRFDPDGNVRRVGGGFLMTSGAAMSSLAFGPDGALYASSFEADRVYRFAKPQVPGAMTTIYARVTDPVRLAFAPDGTLYAGRDNSGSGGDYDDAVRIHRVERGGVTVTEYGAAAVTDPDAVAYDAEGGASGVAGAVLVAGHELNSLSGKIVLVRPDQTLSTVYGPTGFTFNPNVFEYDLDGRLMFSDDEGGKVWTMTNGMPTVLFNLAGALQLTADRLNRLVVGVNGQETLRLYDPAGALLTNRFADVAVNSPLARGPGGEWGTGVYCVSPRGELWSLDTEGTVTRRGTSFGIPYDMVFGPDEALYVSEFNSDLIWRISFRPQLWFAPVDDGLELSWLSQGDYVYQLESTTELVGAVWTPEGEVLDGTGGELTLTVFPGTEPQKFYRLRMEAK